MTSNQNPFMFLKAGPYNQVSDDLYSDIVRYCQTTHKTFLKENNDSKNDTFLGTCKDIMCGFQVLTRRQNNTTIWNLTQDSLNYLKCMDSHLGIEMPQCILLFLWHTHRLDNVFLWQAYQAVLRNTTRRLLVSTETFIWKTLMFMHADGTEHKMVLFSSLGRTSNWIATLKQLNKDILMVYL